jgi:hypothetical protein
MTDMAIETQAAELPDMDAGTPPEARSRLFKPAAGGGVQWRLASVMAISFSLTFVLVSIALLAGLLPRSLTTRLPADLGVLLLMVPLSALVIAMLGEALRAALDGVPDRRAPRAVTALSTWRPGSREG